MLIKAFNFTSKMECIILQEADTTIFQCSSFKATNTICIDFTKNVGNCNKARLTNKFFIWLNTRELKIQFKKKKKKIC